LKIAIIGTGNLAFHLTKRLIEIGNPPSLIISRNLKNGQSFVDSIGLDSVAISTAISQDCDLIFLAVPDRQIANQSIEEKYLQKSIVVHLSGSQNITSLSSFSNYGVLYPLQTFTKEKQINWDNIPILIEGNNVLTLEKIKSVAELLTKKVIHCNSEERLKVHLSAVLSCNFTNYLYQLAQKHLNETGLVFSDLQHLIQETIDKAVAIGPEKAQTGPAIRGDGETIRLHLELLDGNESEKSLYSQISKSINPNLKL